MNNMMNVFEALQSAIQNPAAILQRFGLGADALQNPQAAVQQLMSSGRMTQQQFNQMRQTAMQIQNNPMFMGLFKN